VKADAWLATTRGFPLLDFLDGANQGNSGFMPGSREFVNAGCQGFVGWPGLQGAGQRRITKDVHLPGAITIEY
jgi:hypothetical protein